MQLVMKMFRLDGEKKEEKLSRTFRIPVSLIDELEKLAAEKDLSVNKIVIKCIKYALDNFEDEN